MFIYNDPKIYFEFFGVLFCFSIVIVSLIEKKIPIIGDLPFIKWSPLYKRESPILFYLLLILYILIGVFLSYKILQQIKL